MRKLNIFSYFVLRKVANMSKVENKAGFTLARGATHVDTPPTNAKAGFTLAEILITLGIIGIVAAMTMPALMANINKRQTETKLKKAYSMINQAYRLSYNEVGDATASDAHTMGIREYFKTYWQPYIKADVCTTYKGCGYNANSPWTKLNGEKEGTGLINGNTRIPFYTPDGIMYVIYVTTFGSKEGEANGQIIVDINGPKQPNRFGKDTFVFVRNQTEGGVEIVPAGNTANEKNINQNCSTSGKGTVCAEKIRRAGWKIDSTYPW